MTEPPPARESLWRRWVINPVAAQLSQGTEPRKISLALACGVTVGLFPLLGTPTLVSLAVGAVLKLNQPVLQVFRELTYPLHLASILLFIRAGELLFAVPHTPLTLPMMISRFSASPPQFLKDYGMLGLYAVTVWLLLAPLLASFIYWGSLPLVTKLSNRLTRAPHAS